ncbi:predicted protein [Sclerotinia sclerotiorum 1980 UF-70]|uniref:Uncharacterized protein n=2 Tax=Sclerotinia sclerotiorum (strain ATCC 18683 / 1980 / Ss-1) TaxID=665079 RepID=A7EXU3_SCLS1|nr:predicted protein [Sclerotinia sclerotiorum 1980 UF-70]APA16041.1 hypothetical protein sscle_16g108110 [Sclerotinia sclerotiorum 1980 UF-70]EDN94285.1 predicted protein [Sclerotinia sclerotiorum 1980 UF-70]
MNAKRRITPIVQVVLQPGDVRDLYPQARHEVSDGTAPEQQFGYFSYRAAMTDIQQTQFRLGRIPRSWRNANLSLIG